MANSKYKKRSKRNVKSSTATVGKQPTPWKFPLGRENAMIMLVGVAIIVVGYVLMGTAITDNEAEYLEVWNNPLAVIVAPLLLVIGYCVCIPLGLMWRKRSQEAVGADS